MRSQAIGHGLAPKQMQSARNIVHRAELWRLDNPDAWARMVERARELASFGQPIGGRSLVESVRKVALVDRYGCDVRINNSYAPVFARWLYVEHPELRPYIELRRSAVGVVMGV